jgi:hypothetical protein
VSKFYLETWGEAGSYGWKIYHYDETGNRELLDHRSVATFDSPNQAVDAGVEFADEKGIEVEIV